MSIIEPDIRIYKIKETDPDKLKEALELIWAVFTEFEAPEYSEEGINEFRDYIDYPQMKGYLAQFMLEMWAYQINSKIAGVIAVRVPCHISLLFVNKEYHRQGIAARLMQEVIDYLKENRNCRELTVNSSPYAIDFYHKIGFTDSGKQETTNGITFTPMKLSL